MVFRFGFRHKGYRSGSMKRTIQFLVLSLLLFCLTTPFCVSETIPSLSDGHYKAQRNKGEIDFEIFRQISTGMTRQQVLNLAGPPAEQFVRDSLGQSSERWRYYYGSNWVAELSFNKFGQVANITSYRRQ